MNFQENLSVVIKRWNSGDVDDEWMFQKIRDDHVGQMNDYEAFAEIPQTLRKLQNEVSEATATEIMDTLIALAQQSKTTEVPQALLSAKDGLRRQFRRYGEYSQESLNTLLRHYRL